MLTSNFLNSPAWRWGSQFDELERMRNSLDNLRNVFGQNVYRAPGPGVFPLVNLTEDNNNYYLRAELPGVAADQIDIQSAHNNITLAGERQLPQEDQNARFHRRERKAGNFSRIIKLPGEIDNDKIEARLQDGILTLIIPKAEESKPRQIKVQ